MDRRKFIRSSLAVSVAATVPVSLLRSASVIAQESSLSTIKPIRVNLSSPGRIGFYVDYSELDETGEHVFYICRTHGTTGSVSVKFSTHGDDHESAQGVISWGNGEADIKSFRVSVNSKSSGEHRIYAQLSDPTGGARLQFGDHTRAYGVIDDDTISTNAVFFDADLTINGNGTQASPYNNIYDALESVGNKRFIYGKGTFKPDGTHKVGPYSHKGRGISTGNPRSNEENRLIIRAWPGHSLVVDGAGDNDSFGFFCGNDESYHTYKNIQIKNLSSTDSSGAPCGAIWYHYGDRGSQGITVEQCDISSINGLENQGGINPYGVNGFKVWRCDIKNIAKEGDTTNGNTAGVLSYNGRSISVQRCSFTKMSKGTYQKRVENAGDISICCRFNLFNRASCYYGRSGDSNPGHSHTIVQSNIFIGDNGGSLSDGVVHKTHNTDLPGRNFWLCNNVFDGCGEGTNGAINLKLAGSAMIFNNIFMNCRRSWTEYFDGAPFGVDIRIADYNHLHNTSYKHYMWRGEDYKAGGALSSTSIHARNDVVGLAPGFVDPSSRDYRLEVGSPCIGTGYGGIDKGVYITRNEAIGPGESVVKSKILLEGRLKVEAI